MNSAEAENRFAELVAFIRELIGEYNVVITRETSIENDLGISGDEADDLLAAFSEKFGVDISAFDFEKYFYDEPGVFNLQNRIVELFSVGHLEKAIMAGRLNDEVINS